MQAESQFSPQPPQDVRECVQSQFGPVAASYVTSTQHAQGPDLARLVELAATTGSETLLDVATGGGHTALTFTPRVARVVASDLTLTMLQAARQHLRTELGPLPTSRLGYCRATAEALPFATASFDLVTCRLAAHHFADIHAFAVEAARVLRPGGRLLVADHIGLEDADLDSFMDRFERWRDPSHVRAYSFPEWHGFCAAAGLQVEHTEDLTWPPYEFASWTARMRMDAADKRALERWLLAAPRRYRETFAIVEQNGRVVSLRSVFGILVARRAATPLATGR